MEAQPKEDVKLQELFEKAHRDPALKMRLLNDPKGIAKEWGVTFGEREIAQLTKVGAFLQVAQDIQSGSLYRACDPRVCYPLTVWRNRAVVDLAMVLHRWRWVLYPPPPEMGFRGQERFGT